MLWPEKLGRKGNLHTISILWQNEDAWVRIGKIGGSAIQDPSSWIFISVQEAAVSNECLALYVCCVSFAAVFFKQAEAKDSLAQKVSTSQNAWMLKVVEVFPSF